MTTAAFRVYLSHLFDDDDVAVAAVVTFAISLSSVFAN